MKISQKTILIALLLMSTFLAGCAGGASPTTSWPSPVADPERDSVYLAGGTHIYALNLANGTEKWRYPEKAGKAQFYAPPALTRDGQLIAVSYDNIVYSLNPANGQLEWTFSESASRLIAAPLVHGEDIFVASSDYHLYALTLAGNLKWKYETKQALWSTPAVNGKHIFQPGMDHLFYALDMETGEPVWISEDLGGAMVGTPVVGPEGIVYIGTFGSEMIALEGDSGKVVWSLPTSGWVWSGGVLVDGVLYFGDLGGTLYAVNAQNGSILWQIKPESAAQKAIAGQPLLVGETVYFSSEAGTFFAVDAKTGNPRWSKLLGGRTFAGPVAAGEKILVALYDADSLLVALDLNGNIIWSYQRTK